LHDSIIIWPPGIIDECPYEVLLRSKLSVDSNDTLIDSENRLLFKVVDIITVSCKYMAPNNIQWLTYNITLFSTSEGLLVLNHPYWFDQPVVNSSSLTTSTEFLLADKDYELRRTFRLNDHITEHLCMQFLTTILAISRFSDTYV
jgi:hypothetical protein